MYWPLTCPIDCFQKPSMLSNYKQLYADKICCLCTGTSYKFGSYFFTILMALLGIALILADMCRTVTNGPLPVCVARQNFPSNKWYLCPRLERDLILLGSFFNLLICVTLFVGLISECSTLLLPWLIYKIILVSSLVPIWLVHLAMFHESFIKWGGLVTLCFNAHNILQVMCVSMDFD